MALYHIHMVSHHDELWQEEPAYFENSLAIIQLFASQPMKDARGSPVFLHDIWDLNGALWCFEWYLPHTVLTQVILYVHEYCLVTISVVC